MAINWDEIQRWDPKNLNSASRQLRELAAAGANVVVLSSDVDEIREVSDRVLILVDGSVRLDSYNSELAFDKIVATMSEVA